MSIIFTLKNYHWIKVFFTHHNYLNILFLCAGILISCIHLNVFYYSYDTPKWLIFDLVTSFCIIYFFKNKQTIIFSYFGVVVLLFIYYMLASIIWAANKTAAIELSLRFINAVLFIYFLINHFDKDKLQTIFLNTCFLSALAFSILFYFERYVLGHTNYNVGNYSPIGFMNNAGAVFNVWIPALILNSIKQFQRKNTFLLITVIITTIAIVSILMEAATRGTIIGLTIFEIIVFFMVFRKNKKRAFLYITITSLLLTGMVTYKLSDALQSGRLEGKFLALSTNLAAASDKRIQLYKNTWEMTLDNPMGVGINNFEFNHPKYGKPGTEFSSPYINENQILTTPHNLVLKIYSELGLLFGSVFVLILLYLLITAFINALKGCFIDKWLFVALGATLFHSMLSAVLITPVSLFFSCFLIGLIIIRIDYPIIQLSITTINIPKSVKGLYLITPFIFIALMYASYLSFTGYKQDNYEKMKQAILINPYHSRTLYNLSFYEIGANRDTTQSLFYIDQFLKSYPYHISGLQIKAERHYQLKEYRLATQTIDHLLHFYPSYQTANRLKLQINSKVINESSKEQQ
ncbi:O-antigen ligase family protein [Marinicellulosiphila megalodicopiae]|uniref:O-antigen ligase family protein n=1 Tax=Marinicellulosiphila megalodicopiae TaxID=2724896 RepID=UPI003BB1DBA6